jgi:hypothetical protein
MDDEIDTSDEACAVACMLVSNPQGAMHGDGDGWQKRVNDLIRALRDERTALRRSLAGIVDHWNEFGDMVVLNNAVNRDDYGMSERIDAAAKLVNN